MDWCGIVGDVNEVFRTKWIVRFHWKVQNITSMPDKLDAVYFSPSLKFFDVKWYLGIFRYGRFPGKVWIGLEIWRTNNHLPKSFHFSIGLMHADQIEHLTHRNQNYPATTNYCSINEFLPVSALSEIKDKIAPLDALTVTCVIWQDIFVPEELNSPRYRELKLDSERKEDAKVNSLPYLELNLYSEREEVAKVNSLPYSELNLDYERKEDAKGRDRASSEAKMEDRLGATAGDETLKTTTDNRNKPTSVSVDPDKNVGIVREVSRGVEWEVRLPPPMKPWAFLSPEFTCGEIKYYFNLHPDELNSDCVCVRFIASISSEANFPLPIRWRMAVKRADLNGFRWIMSGQMTVQEEYLHLQEIPIKRAELESLLSSDARLTFVHHLSVSEVDADKEVSAQTDFEEFHRKSKLSLRSPEEGEPICTNQHETFEASCGNHFSDLRRRDMKHFMFAA